MMELINPPEAFTIGAYGRSQLLREIMAGISEKDRGWLITLCTNCIPTEIDFIDGIIVIIILCKIGIVDHNKYPWYCRDEFGEHSVVVNEYTGEEWMYKYDERGRITELFVGGLLYGDDCRQTIAILNPTNYHPLLDILKD